MSNIVLANKFSEVILLKGKCYSFYQETDSKITNPLSDISGSFLDCSNCFDSVIRIKANETIDVGDRVDNMSFLFLGLSEDVAELLIGSHSFIIKNVDDSLVWDFGSVNSHVFSILYDTITVSTIDFNFDVVFTGNDNLSFSIINFS